MRTAIPLTLLLVACVVCVACGGHASDSPASVSERFIDREFIEVDQEGAIPLTDGPARAALEQEVADVRAVRGAGGDHAQGRGKVYRERVWLSEDREQGMARAIYNLTIDTGREKDRRHVLVSMKRLPVGWRVTSFSVQEGPAQAPTEAPVPATP